MAAAPVVPLPLTVVTGVVVGSTLGLNLGTLGPFEALPGSVLMGGLMLSGCMNANTAVRIASGVATTYELVASPATLAFSREVITRSLIA